MIYQSFRVAIIVTITTCILSSGNSRTNKSALAAMSSSRQNTDSRTFARSLVNTPIRNSLVPDTSSVYRVSVSSNGNQASNDSLNPSISADGMFLVFESKATDLYPVLDDNNKQDVFLRNMITGEITPISVNLSLDFGNGNSGFGRISAYGNCVAYQSESSNLVSGDNNAKVDIFVKNLISGEIERASVSSSEAQANSDSLWPAISADCHYVAFASTATNLVSGDNVGGFVFDIFLRDLWAGTTIRVSEDLSGSDANNTSEYPAISADGRFVAYESMASDLVIGESNLMRDIFRYDRILDENRRASLTNTGGQANSDSYKAAISADGQMVLFWSYAHLAPLEDPRTNSRPIHVYIRDMTANTTKIVSKNSNQQPANYNSWYFDPPAISYDGRFASFTSAATNLGADMDGWDDIFVRDLISNTTILASQIISPTNNGRSKESAIASGGSYVAFSSTSSAMVVEDTNGKSDVFVNDGVEGTHMDLSISEVTPIQAVYTAKLVDGKSTAVRVVMEKLGASPLSNVQLKLEFDGKIFDKFYVDDFLNYDGLNERLKNNNEYFPLSFSSGKQSKTVYFIDQELKPDELLSYDISVTVDPSDVYQEINEFNNTNGNSYPVITTEWPPWGFNRDLMFYFTRLDWPGRVSTQYFTSFYDRETWFLQAIFPVATENYKPFRDLIESNYIGAFDGTLPTLTEGQIVEILRDIAAKGLLAEPKADRVVAAVPPFWFEVATNLAGVGGVTYGGSRSVIVEAGTNSNPLKRQLSAHELLHTYGFGLACEEYDLSCNPDGLGIGNKASSGFWIDERTLINPESRPIYCALSTGTSINVWIEKSHYEQLRDEFSPSSYSAPDEPPAPFSQSILAVGTVISPNQATLDNWYVLPDADPEWTENGDYTFEFRDAGGNLIDDFDVDISMALNAVPGPQVYQLDQMPFAVILPYFDGTKQIVLKKEVSTLATKTVSANAPIVVLTSPNGGEALSGLVNVTWSGSDLDGDDLEYSLLVSNDNALNWATVQVGLSSTNYLWDTSLLPPGNQYLFRVIVTDGVNTSQDISQSTFTILKKIWLPLVHGK